MYRNINNYYFSRPNYGYAYVNPSMKRYIIYSTNFSYESASEAIARRLTSNPEERAKTKEEMQAYLKSLPRAQLKSTLRLLGVGAMDLAEKHRRQLVKRAEAAGTDTDIPDLAVNVLDMVSPYMLKHAKKDREILGLDAVVDKGKSNPVKPDENHTTGILTAANNSINPALVFSTWTNSDKQLTPETNKSIISMLNKPRPYTNNAEVIYAKGSVDYPAIISNSVKKRLFDIDKMPIKSSRDVAARIIKKIAPRKYKSWAEKVSDAIGSISTYDSPARTLPLLKSGKLSSDVVIDSSRVGPEVGIHELSHSRDIAHGIMPSGAVDQEMRANRTLRSVGSHIPTSNAKDRAVIHNTATTSDNNYVNAAVGKAAQRNEALTILLHLHPLKALKMWKKTLLPSSFYPSPVEQIIMDPDSIKPEDLEALQALRQKHDRGFRA